MGTCPPTCIAYGLMLRELRTRGTDQRNGPIPPEDGDDGVLSRRVRTPAKLPLAVGGGVISRVFGCCSDSCTLCTKRVD